MLLLKPSLILRTGEQFAMMSCPHARKDILWHMRLGVFDRVPSAQIAEPAKKMVWRDFCTCDKFLLTHISTKYKTTSKRKEERNERK